MELPYVELAIGMQRNIIEQMVKIVRRVFGLHNYMQKLTHHTRLQELLVAN